MDNKRSIARFRKTFKALGTSQRAMGEKAYLKSDLDFYGATVPQIQKVAKTFLMEHADVGRADLLSLVAALWKTRHHELRFVGIVLLEGRTDLLLASDMAFVEDLIRRSNTWAYVDNLAANVAGPLVQRYVSARKRLGRWSRDDSFWVRRASMLALLKELRAGEGDFDLFARFAESMLDEREFFIRKAIGWVLRETGKRRPERTIDFLAAHLDRAAPLIVREGVKRLPEADRARLLRALADRKRMTR